MNIAQSATTSEYMKDALKQYFGFGEFRSGQEDVISQVLHGRDSMVLMPTGGGKSLCYQLPALLLPGVTIVISPLIALMKDQVDALNRQGIAADFINSSLSQEQINDIFYRLGQGQIKLLYIAPERLGSRYFLDGLKQLHVSLFAIDEAHCISQWGHDFRPAYTKLSCLKREFPTIPVLALTATADVTTRKDILSQLNLQNPYIQIDSFDRPNIRLTMADKYKGMDQMVAYIKKHKNDAGIIYCNSRWQVENVSKQLAKAGINCAAYHAGMEVEIRNSIQDGFAKDNIQVVVATIAFGLGINKSNIRFVIHFEPPRTLESYYQEIGRAGRDGMPSEALFLYQDEDVSRVQKRIQEGEDAKRAAVEGQRFSAVQGFIEAQTCRRQVILNYFAEYADQRCGNCDICLDPPSEFDGTVATQKVLSCVYRAEQKANADTIVQVLRGQSSAKVISQHYQKLSTFGIGQDKTPGYWHSIIRQLLHMGYLQQDISQQSALTLTQAASSFLRNSESIQLASPRLQKASYWKQAKSPANYDRKLFAKLRTLRKEIADAEDIAPYIVFNDATLSQLASIKPQTSHQMLSVSGIGETKLARYGAPFLSLIKEHLAS